MVPTPTLAIPTPHDLAALVYPTLDELAVLLPDTSETHRFLDKLVVAEPPPHAPHLGPCLRWRRPNNRGYGMFKSGDQYPGKPRAVSAHLWLDYQLHGPMPEGYEADHICHEPLLCTVPPHQCPHRACVLHTLRKTRRDNRLRVLSQCSINAAKIRCDGSEVDPDPITGEKIGHLLTNPDGTDTENVYRPPKRPNERKCRPCHVRRRARWEAKARRLKAAARARGLREAGTLELF